MVCNGSVFFLRCSFPVLSSCHSIVAFAGLSAAADSPFVLMRTSVLPPPASTPSLDNSTASDHSAAAIASVVARAEAKAVAWETHKNPPPVDGIGCVQPLLTADKTPVENVYVALAVVGLAGGVEVVVRL